MIKQILTLLFGAALSANAATTRFLLFEAMPGKWNFPANKKN